LVEAGAIVEEVAFFGRGMAKLGRDAATALARLGASLWSSTHLRIREEALRQQVARLGDDLQLELGSLLTRCQTLLDDVRSVDATHQLSASDQRCLTAGFEAYLARVRELKLQAHQALQDLVTPRGGALEDRSNRLNNLDVEICLLSSEIADCEALCRTLWADDLGEPAPLRVA
jgi:hypothetical protein